MISPDHSIPASFDRSSSPAVVGAKVEGSDKSFQAGIHVVNGGADVAKIYAPINLFGLVDLANSEVRRDLLKRECACLSALSPGLNPRIETVTTPDGSTVEALVMKRLEPTAFLDGKLLRSESINADSFRKLAAQLADFHFNPNVCPTEAISLVGFLKEKVIGLERQLLLEIGTKSNLKVDPDVVNRWFGIVEKAVAEHADRIDTVAQLLGEPIRGHGDVKSQNIAISERGEVFVLDTAPFRPWQTNTRRMDAAFLYAELMLSGRPDDARCFWECYDEAYRSNVTALGKGYEDGDLVGETVALLDKVSQFYRFIIFYRLTFLGVDPERAPDAARFIDMITRSLEGKD